MPDRRHARFVAGEIQHWKQNHFGPRTKRLVTGDDDDPVSDGAANVAGHGLRAAGGAASAATTTATSSSARAASTAAAAAGRVGDDGSREFMAAGAGPPPVRTVTRSTGRAVAAAIARQRHAIASVATRRTRSPWRCPPVSEEAASQGVEQGVAAFVKPPPMEVGKFSVIKFVAGPNEAAIGAETEGEALTRSTRSMSRRR